MPEFDTATAMGFIESELGAPWYDIYEELQGPVAAASLGQVYKGRLKGTGEEVAVKVQRPAVLETITVDLHIIRQLGLFLRRFPKLTERADLVDLLDEWAARFFEELDYRKEGRNATDFAKYMQRELPQVVVPKTYEAQTARRVLTSAWIDGEKLAQSTADDVGDLVNIGVICYLKQLLDSGHFHADPHPGNMIRTPDGRLAVLDFGLMTKVDDDIKYGMIDAISHLIHRDYEAIVEDFVTLQFIPKGTDLRPLLPVLTRVFDAALAGGGAKGINFQDLSADLAQITFDYPFRIPPYFALIIRAISVLEGIALVGNPDFAIVDEAYPYIAQRLLTDDTPRLRAALRYMLYGKGQVFDADRLIDVLEAFETFTENAQTAQGDVGPAEAPAGPAGAPQLLPVGLLANALPAGAPFQFALPPALLPAGGGGGTQSRAAFKFIFSEDGAMFREILLDEVVRGIDALSREQAVVLAGNLGLQGVQLPVLLPGAARSVVGLAPKLTPEDQQIVENIGKLAAFLTRSSTTSGQLAQLAELAPLAPEAAPVVAEISRRLSSRIVARTLRELYAPGAALGAF